MGDSLESFVANNWTLLLMFTFCVKLVGLASSNLMRVLNFLRIYGNIVCIG